MAQSTVTPPMCLDDARAVVYTVVGGYAGEIE